MSVCVCSVYVYWLKIIAFLTCSRCTDDRIVTLRNVDLPPLHVRYVDLLAAMDACVLKTGYGIVSEVIVNRVVAIYSDRYC